MREETRFEFVGGHPLIDLVNTEVKYLAMPNDLLKSEADFWQWLDEAGIRQQRTAPASNGDLLPQVRTFRQRMRMMLNGIVRKNVVDEKAITYLNDQVAKRQGRLQLVEDDNGQYQRQFRYQLETPEHVLAMLADIATQFVTDVDLRYLKRCENKTCIRFFLDTSKNHSRRWCSMKGCGNRMKARAHYARRTRNKH